MRIPIIVRLTFSFLVLIASEGRSQYAASTQKKTVDLSTFENWSELLNSGISNNGKFVWHSYSGKNTRTAILRNVEGTYEQKFLNTDRGVFTADNKYFISSDNKNTTLIELRSGKSTVIEGATSPFIPTAGNGRWLGYAKGGGFVLRDLFTNKERIFEGALQMKFNTPGTRCAINYPGQLAITETASGKTQTIATGALEPWLMNFDNTGEQIVFLSGKEQEMQLRYFRLGMDSAIIKKTNSSNGLLENYYLTADPPSFSSNGSLILFKLKTTDKYPEDKKVITPDVNVWNYKDMFLQSEQRVTLPGYKEETFMAVTKSGREDNPVIQMEDRKTNVVGRLSETYAIIANRINYPDLYWNISHGPYFKLLNLQTGERVSLPAGPRSVEVTVSPAERFLVWFDKEQKQYFSYEIKTREMRNLAPDIKNLLVAEQTNRPEPFAYGYSGWIKEDRYLLLKDQYDIWKVDVLAEKESVNITKGYGRKHQIRFRSALVEAEFKTTVYSEDEILLLSGLDDNTRQNVFLKCSAGGKSPVKFLKPQRPGLYTTSQVGFFPMEKARDADMYVLSYQTASLSPNACITKDFEKFTIISDVHPEKEYNWMTAELITWNITSNKKGRGILYKPENFDSSKKYPVIFHYYEGRTQELFLFKKPETMALVLDIPRYVSNDYLVFVPDIQHRTGHTAEDITNTAVTAADKLAEFSFIDTSKMGLQGHSFGGYVTNVIISNTTRFTAAQESSGVSNPFSWFGDVGFGGKSHAFMFEYGQTNLGTTPWEGVDAFIKNSPVVNSNKIQTPLLIMHNPDDDAVGFAQGRELFIALRRQQKPVWMVEYDREDHIFREDRNIKDFAIRQQQFFAHYLKGEAMPRWMSHGIPAAEKGINSGL